MNLVKLNGVFLNLNNSEIQVFHHPMPNPQDLRQFERIHGDDWWLTWRGGHAYGLPKLAQPRVVWGEPVPLKCADHLHLVGKFVLSRIQQYFVRTKTHRVFAHRTLDFINENQNLLDSVQTNMRNPPPILDQFKIFGRFKLGTKLLKTQDTVQLGLMMRFATRWEIQAPLQELTQAGVDLAGLGLVRRNPKVGERRLIGLFGRMDGRNVILLNSLEKLPMMLADDVRLEGSPEAFGRCLRTILGAQYDQFETEREVAESAHLNSIAFDKRITRTIAWLSRTLMPLDVGGGLVVSLGSRIEVANTPNDLRVRSAGPDIYTFNRAGSKVARVAWSGVENHGPFAERHSSSPRIAVIYPAHLAARTENFIRWLQSGRANSTYSHGFDSVFRARGISEFYRCPLNQYWSGTPIETRYVEYRGAAEKIASSRTKEVHSAIVVIADSDAYLRDSVSPYLHTKAVLLRAGIPVQAIREATLNQWDGNMQYTLQNFAVSLHAKLGGVPWTITPPRESEVADEIVLGLGCFEVKSGRFEQGLRYVGITTVFRADGTYLCSNLADACAYSEYPDRLRQSVSSALEHAKGRNGWQHGDTIRVIVHSYKTLRNTDVASIIRQAVSQVGYTQSVQFAFATVAHDHDFAVFDPAQEGRVGRVNQRYGVLAPERGTLVQIGHNSVLVCTRGPSLINRECTPIPRPVYVHLHRSSTFKDIWYIAEQVLRFTALSWQSVRPVAEPSTIGYSEMIAEHLSRLRSVEGWDASVLNDKLCESRWFL